MLCLGTVCDRSTGTGCDGQNEAQRGKQGRAKANAVRRVEGCTLNSIYCGSDCGRRQIRKVANHTQIPSNKGHVAVYSWRTPSPPARCFTAFQISSNSPINSVQTVSYVDSVVPWRAAEVRCIPSRLGDILGDGIGAAGRNASGPTVTLVPSGTVATKSDPAIGRIALVS